MKNQSNNQTEYKTTTIAKLPRGEWFTLKANPNAKMYEKYDYDRTSKRYLCTDVLDAGGAGRELKGTTTVFYGFTY
jgi:hypothetical protein